MSALCQAGCKTENPCANEATVDAFGLDEPTLCEQHHRTNKLACEQDEWEIARQYVAAFAELAKVIDVDPLNSVVDLAWAECELRLSALEAERRMVWE